MYNHIQHTLSAFIGKLHLENKLLALPPLQPAYIWARGCRGAMTNPLHRVTITHVTALWDVAGVQETADVQMKSQSVHKKSVQCVN